MNFSSCDIKHSKEPWYTHTHTHTHTHHHLLSISITRFTPPLLTFFFFSLSFWVLMNLLKITFNLGSHTTLNTHRHTHTRTHTLRVYKKLLQKLSRKGNEDKTEPVHNITSQHWDHVTHGWWMCWSGQHLYHHTTFHHVFYYYLTEITTLPHTTARVQRSTMNKKYALVLLFSEILHIAAFLSHQMRRLSSTLMKAVTLNPPLASPYLSNSTFWCPPKNTA